MAHLPEKILVLVFALTLPSVVIWKISSQPKVLGSSDQVLENYSEQITFWQTQVSKYPDYRDGYLKLAEAYKKSGDVEAARQQVQLALRVDPNLVLPLQLADLQ